MNWLLTSDLHLSDRPRDAYRFGIFAWLRQQQAKHNVQATFLLGDLTDRKDNHSATLVNRIVDELLTLKPPVYLLKGNHDFISPENPYFGFLSRLPGIRFISKPTVLKSLGVVLVPHQPDQAGLNRACQLISRETTMVALHNTFTGAIAETGARLTGLRWPVVGFGIKPPRGVWAGDVHRPQHLACGLEYVGAPYHLRFNDNFEPRVVLLEGKEPTDLHFPAPRKLNLQITGPHATELAGLGQRGDHVKITVTLNREQVTDWPACKAEVLATARDLGFEVFGINLIILGDAISAITGRVTVAQAKSREPKAIFDAYCTAEKLPPAVKQVGADILEE